MPAEQSEDQADGYSRRDYLALVRTDLANERTMLAYGRTSLMIAATAITIFKFFPDASGVRSLALGLAGISIVLIVIGIWRFVSLRRRLRI